VPDGSARPPSASILDPLFQPDDRDINTDRLEPYKQQFYERYFTRTDLQESAKHVCPGHH
jgi:hypothetical protein